MRGVDRVFHCAGLTSVRPADARRLFDVNAGGTRIVLGECLRKGVERVVFTSSAAALGPAKPGGTADETQHAAGPSRHPVRELGARGRGARRCGSAARGCSSCA